MTIIAIYGIHELNDKQQGKVRRTIEMSDAVVNGQIFERKMLAAPSMTERNGMTQGQILTLFKSGADPDPAGGKPADGVIRINITGFWSASNTIGWTTLGGVMTHINRRYLDKFDEADLFGHIVHETMHRYGFAHRAWLRKNKLSTVPYQYGYRATAAFREHYNGKPKNVADLVASTASVQILAM